MNCAPSRVSLSLVSSAALALLLSACGSRVPLDQPTEKPQPVKTEAPAPAQSAVAPVAPAEAPKPAADTLPRVVYFDFDSFAIKDDFRPLIDAHAKRLTAAPAAKMVIEGHTDERGGSEYNLALGQKRAEAVVKSLTLLGAKADQLEAVSFGKERPAADGHDEEAWAQNRRAELKDR